MSRASHGARVDRLKRQLRGEPVVKITFAPWCLALKAEYAPRRALSADPEARAPRRVGEPEADRS